MDNSFLISIGLLISGILILIQVILFNSDMNRLQITITIGQIIASCVFLIKPYLRNKLIFLISFINTQQILQQTNFDFLFIVLTQILSSELEIDIELNTAFRVLLIISQILRVIFFWENDIFESAQIIFSIIFSSILWIKSYFQSRTKKKSIIQTTRDHNNNFQFNSQTNLIVSLKQLDSELGILDNLPIGIMILDLQQSIKYLNSFAKQYFKNFNCEKNDEISIQLKHQLIKQYFPIQLECYLIILEEQMIQITSMIETILENFYIHNNYLISLTTNIYYINKDYLLYYNQKSNRPFLSSIKIDDPIQAILNQKEEQFNLVYKFQELSKNGITKLKIVKISLLQQFLKSEEVTIVLIENVSSKEKKKELTQFIKFQNSILNSFSHELRTPLNSSLQLLESLSTRLSDQMNQEFVQPVLNSNKLLLFQINDILDYAAMQSNQFIHHYSQFNIKEIADYIQQLYSPIIKDFLKMINKKQNNFNEKNLVENLQILVSCLDDLVQQILEDSCQ